MNYCKNCGVDLHGEAVCPNCGAEVEVEKVEETVAANAEPVSDVNDTGLSIKYIVWSLICTYFCNQLFGLLALGFTVLAAEVRSKVRALQYLKIAKVLNIISIVLFVLTILALVLYFVLYFVIVFAAVMASMGV